MVLASLFINMKQFTSLVFLTSLITPFVKSQVQVCNPPTNPALIDNAGGWIASPNYPLDYGINLDCNWLIHSVTNQLVSLQFVDFATESCCDRAIIYDGLTTSATTVATVYSTPVPSPVYTTTGGYMLLVFRSDGSGSGRGFNATYRPVASAETTTTTATTTTTTSTTTTTPTTTTSGIRLDPACSSATRPVPLTDSRGTLFSPNYPANYDPRSDCRWLIQTSQPNQVISIQFGEFLTEQSYDYLTIYNGNTDSSSLQIAALSGTSQDLSLIYTTSQSFMLLKLTSDGGSENRGFNATYWATSISDNCSYTCNSASRPQVVNTGTSGVLLSPSYPRSVCFIFGCDWLLVAPTSSETIRIRFDDFDISSTNLVEVFDGQNASASRLISLSGTQSSTPSFYTSTQQYMYVRLSNSFISGKRGFNASFTAVAVTTTTPTTTTSTTTTPTTVNPQTLPACSASRPLLINDNAGTIVSPNYPALYADNLDCMWLITTTIPNQVVAIHFTFVETESCCDRINVYDGTNSSTNAPAIVSLSGSPSNETLSLVYTTTQSSMLVWFHTDGSGVRRGFSATYSSVVPTFTTTTAVLSTPTATTTTAASTTTSGGPQVNPACSSATRPVPLTDSRGTLFSPNYPANYDPRSDCRWLIQTSQPNQVISIQFGQFLTEQSYDYLTIYNGNTDSSSLQIAALSGTSQDLNLIYTTSQSFMLLKFTSDGGSENRGFNATYWATSTSDNCSYTCNSATRPQVVNTGTSGVLLSPSYPRSVCFIFGCDWLLVAPTSSETIRIRFDDFDISSTNLVEVFDGQNASASRLISLSGTQSSTPSFYTSTQQYMYIRLSNSFISGKRGFNASFTAVAVTTTTTTPSTTTRVTSPATGSTSTVDPQTLPACSASRPEIINNNVGTITSPNYPGLYTDNLECHWRITTTIPNQVVAIQFTDFETESCCDYVAIYDGSTTSATEIEAVYGTPTAATLAIIYTTTQSTMLVRFHSDSSSVRRGFSANYWSTVSNVTTTTSTTTTTTTTTVATTVNPQTEAACSASSRPFPLTSSVGSISSPNYPAPYRSSLDCQWLIHTTQANQVITIQFTNFATESGYDTVSIYDGDNDQARRIAPVTGYPDVDLLYTTTQSYMLVKFTTDGSVEYTGFIGNYSFTTIADSCTATCNGPTRPQMVTGSSGTILSPGYPRSVCFIYGCDWLISAPSANQILVLHFDDFEMYYNHEVRVYDGRDANAQLITTLYGGGSQSDFVSTGQFIYISLNVSSISGLRGFNASYYVGLAGSVTTRITSTTTTITTPTAPSRTTTSNSQNGFACSALTRPAVFRDVMGTISSPGYIANYDNGLECRWLIRTTRVTEVVSLQFIDFDSETSYDYVYLYDGSSSDTSFRITSVSGHDLDLTLIYTTTQGDMLVRFRTDGSVVFRGFLATYWPTPIEGTCSAPCNGATGPLPITGSSGIVTSPNYPSNRCRIYGCAWLISAPFSYQVIRLHFNDIHTYYDGPIIIYDGQNANASQITTLSGDKSWMIGAEYTSSGQYIFIRFVPSYISGQRGFNVTYTALNATSVGTTTPSTTGPPPTGVAATACNAGLRPALENSVRGIIVSPYYNSNYDNNMECTWLIHTNLTGEVISLSFTDFASETNWDSVYLYDGTSTTSTLIAQVTGSTDYSLIYTSTQSYMLVRFRSDASVLYRGFNATYWSTPINGTCSAPCNAMPRPLLLTAPSGIITSPYYPANRCRIYGCSWLISAPLPTQVIRLHINDFDTYFDGPVELYDGGVINSSLLIVSLSGVKSSVAGAEYTSTQQFMYIRYVTSYISGQRGFNVSYVILNASDVSTTVQTTRPTGPTSPAGTGSTSPVGTGSTTPAGTGSTTRPPLSPGSTSPVGTGSTTPAGTGPTSPAGTGSTTRPPLSPPTTTSPTTTTPGPGVPTVSGVQPSVSPLAGGTRVTINGDHLYFGSSCHPFSINCSTISGVLVNGIPVIVDTVASNSTSLVFISPPSIQLGPVPIVLQLLNGQTINNDPRLTLNYRPNPTVLDLQPREHLIVGGTVVTVIGTNLDSVAYPVITLTTVTTRYSSPGGPVSGVTSTTGEGRCWSIDTNSARCIMPPAGFPFDFHNITSNAIATYVSPDNLTRADIYIGIRLDGYFLYDNISAMNQNIKMVFYPSPNVSCPPNGWQFNPSTDMNLVINGSNLTRGNRLIDVNVTIGDGVCTVTQLTSTTITCTPPSTKPNKGTSTQCSGDSLAVQIFIGNQSYQCSCLTYSTSTTGGGVTNLTMIIAIAVASVAACALLIFVGCILYRAFYVPSIRRLPTRPTVNPPRRFESWGQRQQLFRTYGHRLVVRLR